MTTANLPVRLAGSLAALNREHPLTCPYLTGPADLKSEWLLGYGFAQRLSELDQARMRVALMEHTRASLGAP